jgi:hypothetical protein
MKQKLLSSAVAAALVGAMGTSQAVYNNPDGLGEVLIFPYYTVEGTIDTYINLVNTTSVVKAVKVRFLEGMNSQEVIDFNLYLSPNDHWSGVVTRGSGEAAILKTADTSCTVPAIPAEGITFRDFLYQDDSVNGPERTREGYVEVLEMGTVFDVDPGDPDGFNPATWATHVNGVPEDCGSLVRAWNSGGQWNSLPLLGVEGPVGGMYGYGVLISPPAGTAAGFDALALDDFFGFPTHTNPGSTLPSLEQAAPFSQVVDGQFVYDTFFPPLLDPDFEATAGARATSSVIMHRAILNDYVLAPEIDAGTDWVVNFPTKRFFVNNSLYDVDGDPILDFARPPFTNPWSQRLSQACEEIEITYWDREEAESEVTDVDFSPAPPTEALQLCKEVNVLTFNSSNVLSASERIGADINVDFDNGWARIQFLTGANTAVRTIFGIADAGLGVDFNVFRGLPTIGFAVQNYVNGNLNGVLSNYSAGLGHKYRRSVARVDEEGNLIEGEAGELPPGILNP